MSGDAVARLVDRYDELLSQGDAAAVHARLQRRARELNVTYGDRVVCQVLRPFFLGRSHYDAIHRQAGLVLSALHRAAREARRRPELADWLRLREVDRRLIAIDGGLEHPDVVARLDSFLDPDGVPVFLEYNGESPGGIAYGDCLGRVFDEIEPLRAVREVEPLTRRPVIPEVVAAFREHYEAWCRRLSRPPAAAPSVAIVDLADIPTIGEFELFREAFEAAGMPCRIVDPAALSIDGGRACAQGEPVDIIYRRLLTPDLIAAFGGEHVLVEIMDRRLCFVGNGFGGHLLSHKGLFAMLSDPAHRPQDLTPDEREAVARSVPWTRMAANESTTPPGGSDGRPRPLRDIAMALRERLVLKPALSYGGRDIALGWTSSEAEWAATWEEARQGCWVVQERLHIPSADYPLLGAGGVEHVRLQFDVDPYVLGGRRTHGLGIRLSGGELLNVASGAGSAVPAYLVEAST